MSCGERRRLSLAVELVANPSIVLLDEPTSGLDSHNALLLMSTLQDIAKQGITVLLSIHQPNVVMFQKIDYVILLKNGRCKSQDFQRNISDLLTSRGHPVPEGENPADCLLTWSVYKEVDNELDINPHTSSSRQFSILNANITSSPLGVAVLSTAPERQELTDNDDKNSAGSHFSLAALEIKLLLQREVRRVLRSKHVMLTRFGIVFVGTGIFAIAFAGVARDSSNKSDFSIFSHIGVLFFALLSTVITAPAYMFEFIDGRALFEREYKTGHYGLLTYTFSTGIVESVILLVQSILSVAIAYPAIGFQGDMGYFMMVLYSFGLSLQALCLALASITRNCSVAKEMAGLAIFPQSVFCGFYVAITDLPRWLQWMPYAMPLTYAFRLAIENEFHSCATPNSNDAQLLTCVKGLIASALPNTAVYSENATLTLPQTGFYTGSKSIQEYKSLFHTMVTNVCFPIGTEPQITVNSVSNSMCDATAAAMIFGTFGDGGRIENAGFTSVFGTRMELEVQEDGKSIVNKQHVYWTNPMEPGEIFDYEKLPSIVCDTLFGYCDSKYQAPFDNVTQCQEAMATLPGIQLNQYEQYVYTGNSTGCRYVHQWMVKEDPDTHCPHVSWLSEMDPKGKYKCDDKGLNKSYHNFTQEELALFQQVAFDNGVHEPS